jgi:peptide deformylase
MAVRDVLISGDPRLRQPSRAVAPSSLGSEALWALVQDLRDTMAARDGAGLAAPQIGVPLRVVIFGITHNPRYPQAPPIPETVLVNPEITPLDPQLETAEEGCLSVPGLRAPVPRWRRVRCRAFTPDGEALVREVEGFHARVVQHECDHLAGILFTDRLG